MSMLIVDASYRVMHVIIHKLLINSKHNNAIMEVNNVFSKH